MKLFGKDNQESGNKVGPPEKKNPSKQHPELKIISGNQISQSPSPAQKSSTRTKQRFYPTLIMQLRYRGKGGVGKSTVAANLSLAMAGKGLEVGLMDADVYGPSIPTMMGVKQQPKITKRKKTNTY